MRLPLDRLPRGLLQGIITLRLGECVIDRGSRKNPPQKMPMQMKLKRPACEVEYHCDKGERREMQTAQKARLLNSSKHHTYFEKQAYCTVGCTVMAQLLAASAYS
jgi:hypothetical protein